MIVYPCWSDSCICGHSTGGCSGAGVFYVRGVFGCLFVKGSAVGELGRSGRSQELYFPPPLQGFVLME